jgi:hypothetical protein
VITHVAIRRDSDGHVFSLPSPHRHIHLFRDFESELSTTSSGGTMLTVPAKQGFLDESGRFLDRVAAAEYALASGQVASLAHPPNLYSEDLW